MENENTNKPNLTEKINFFVKEKKKLIIFLISIIVFTVFVFIGYNYFQNKKNEEISEKFIKAGLYLSSEDLENSKQLYQEIIKSKNKFYSPLALNEMIENNLEKNNLIILDFFKIVEKIKLDKEQSDLIKLKKALFLFKISQSDEGKKILEEIVKNNSIWKETALEILKK